MPLINLTVSGDFLFLRVRDGSGRSHGQKFLTELQHGLWCIDGHHKTFAIVVAIVFPVCLKSSPATIHQSLLSTGRDLTPT